MSESTDAVESCAGCGHVWDDFDQSDLAARLRTASEAFAIELSTPGCAQRRTPDRWSRLEYACHVRDVLLVLRERVILASIEDTPSPCPMYPDGRVEAGFYVGEDPTAVAVELGVATDLLIRAYERLDADGLSRGIHYGYPRPAVRSLAWVASQAVHEAEHHLADVRTI